MDPSFNLVDHPWVPVVGLGLVSLMEIFTNPEIMRLAGSPMEQLTNMNLLQAISQRAATPKDDDSWEKMGPRVMARKCAAYLDRMRPRFSLYGEGAFLQMPQLSKARKRGYEYYMLGVAAGDTTVLTHSQLAPELTDALRAQTLLLNSSAGLGSRRVDNTIVLSPGVKKTPTARPGPSVGATGYLHSMVIGRTLWDSLWLNQLTEEDIAGMAVWKNGLGTPPWEQMPEGEECERAIELQHSYMGRLVPLSRFMLLAEDGIHCTEGIRHPSYLEGYVSPSMTADFSGEKPRVLLTDPERKSWQVMPALLSFLKRNPARKGWYCPLLGKAVPRLVERAVTSRFGIWSGGIRVSNTANNQYLSGKDDMVESTVMLNTSWINSYWFDQLEKAMGRLEDMSQAVFASVQNYYAAQRVHDPKPRAREAASIFWEKAGVHARELYAACAAAGGSAENAGAMDEVMRKMARCARAAYSLYCPQGTCRQIALWAKYSPNLNK